MKTVRVLQVDAFTERGFAGNPAGVVPDAGGLLPAEMQAIARELNNPETAFILPSPDDNHDISIRYFTPTVEVPFCGHATIAAHYARAIFDTNGGALTTRQHCTAGTIEISTERAPGGAVRVTMLQTTPVFGAELHGQMRERVLRAVGLTAELGVNEVPVQIVSTGHPKVMIAVRSRTELLRATPDLEALVAISHEIDCNGFFLFALDGGEPGVLTTARMFGPALGIPEDPVTGSAHGPLGAYLVKYGLVPHDGRMYCFRGTQGEVLGRQGYVDVAVRIDGGEPVEAKVTGNAVLLLDGTLYLEEHTC